MCEVCAVFGVGEHWADSAPHHGRTESAFSIMSNRVERRRRIDLLNCWLAADGIAVHDWDGEAFVVEDSAGRMRIASDLSTLWPAIEALAGRSFDPLHDDLHLGPG